MRAAARVAMVPLAAGLAVLIALALWPRADAPAIELSPDSVRFVQLARAATGRYASQQRAIDDGFVRVGVEFPAMGEHWVSFARVLEDSLAPDRPSALIYVNVDGEPKLGGVAYTRLLDGDDEPPPFPFRGAWHEHSGSVDEESLPLRHVHAADRGADHGAGVPEMRGGDSPRVFILHAWIWMPNPAGTFATDNWDLPLLRLGIEGPLPSGAMRALALGQDVDGYYRSVLRTSLALGSREDSLAAAVLAPAQKRARDALRARAPEGTIDAQAARRLERVWDDLWSDLANALPGRAAELERLRVGM